MEIKGYLEKKDLERMKSDPEWGLMFIHRTDLGMVPCYPVSVEIHGVDDEKDN